MSFNRTRWLNKLRPAGASQKADGPEGPMAPIVTTGVSSVGKTFSHIILALGGHANLLCIVPRKRSSKCARHPCARAMLIFTVVPSFRNGPAAKASPRTMQSQTSCSKLQDDPGSILVNTNWFQRGSLCTRTCKKLRTSCHIRLHT